VTPRPWYADGLRFACVPDCGRCCWQEDGRDHVFLSVADVARLSAFLGLSRRDFRRRHARREDGLTLLRFDAPSCPFLAGTRCGVHEARPDQCRTFPFWPETLRRRAAWTALAAYCPGVGQGELVTLPRIRAIRRGSG
jgi:Fe-S-cluster containining protein